MAGPKGSFKSGDKLSAVASPSPVTLAGMRVSPLSVDSLPALYKKAVLEMHPCFEDADIVEAYLGYGPANTPNYRCWYQMMVMDLSMADR